MGGFVFVIGTRPDMIKMAPLILECQSRDMNIEVIHAGQHYDLNMDQIFVDGLKLPKLTHRLLDTEEVRGKTPSWIFNRIYTRMYAYLYEKRGYWIVSVYGDTWSALACALASQKLGFRVAHIEAGLRSYDLTMPEEGARVQMDAISDVLFPPTKTQAQILKDEGVRGQSYQCGNLIVDALALIRPVEDGFRGYDRFAVMTLHRPENVDNIGRLREALRFVEQTARRDDLHVMWPVHPRAAKQLKNLNFEFPEHIHQSPPVGYATMVSMLRRCTVVFTDMSHRHTGRVSASNQHRRIDVHVPRCIRIHLRLPGSFFVLLDQKIPAEPIVGTHRIVLYAGERVWSLFVSGLVNLFGSVNERRDAFGRHTSNVSESFFETAFELGEEIFGYFNNTGSLVFFQYSTHIIVGLQDS